MSESVAATFVFTDLVGSTALATSLDPAQAEALRRQHFGVLRAAIQTTGGREVKNLGDGLMVVFLSPSRALACAVAMQQGIERRNRRDEHTLSVRIGMSLGEATEEDGDFFGDPVVEASRLCAFAEGGQILVSELLRLTVGRHATHEFSSVGDLELKGLPQPVHAFEVPWEPTEDTEQTDKVPLPPRLVAAANGGLFGFCGRAEETAALRAAHKRAESERTLEVTFVAGEPGVGKTTLVACVARDAHAQGTTVLLGECTEDSNAPYLPWVSALSHLVRHTTPESLEQIRPVHATALRRLLPAEADRFPTGEAVQSDPDTERFLLMEAVVQLLELASAQNPVLIVLDDLQWVDASSLALLRHLIASQTPLACPVIGTYRQSDLSLDHPLTMLLADVHRVPSANRIDLAGLAENEIVELIEVAAGYELDDTGIGLAHVLRRETDGNPFFVGELLRHLGESGTIAMDDMGRYGLVSELDQLALPQSVRDVVVQRVVRLGNDTRRVLATASILGREFDLVLLEKVAEVDGDDLLDLLDAAANAAVVTESEDANRYRFAHGLIQSALYADLSVARRQRLHLRVAEILETELDQNSEDTGLLSELARHWQAATKPADGGKAIEYARRAGDAAMAGLAPDDAARFYNQALDLLDRDDSADRRQLFEVVLALGSAQLAAEPSVGRETLRRAGLLAEALGDPKLLVVWASTRVFSQSASDTADDETLRLLMRTLELIPDDDHAGRARVLAALVDEMNPDDWSRRHELADAALAAAEAASDEDVLLDVFVATSFMTSPDRVPGFVERAARALEIVEQKQDPVALGTVLGFYSSAALCRADIDGARRAVERIEELAGRYGAPVIVNAAGNYQAGMCMLAGDLVGLEHQAQRLLELGLRGFPAALASYGGAIFELHWARDTIQEFAELYRASPVDPRAYAGFRPALVLVSLAEGDVEGARSLFDLDAGDGFASFPQDSVWMACMMIFAEVSIILGDREAAERLHGLLTPWFSRHCGTGPIYYGVVARPVGRLAAFLGRLPEAEERLRWALGEHRRVGAHLWAATTAVDLAEVLHSSASVEGTREADRLLDEAEVAARNGGYGAILNRLQALRATS